MNEVADIVACPVCGTEVSLTDTRCPKCNAEFAPGVMDEPLDTSMTARKKERKSGSESGKRVLPSTQAVVLAVTYAVGYGSIIAANYVSSGGIVNQMYELVLLAIGGLTLAVSVASALLMGRIGGIQASRVSFALVATFVLLIPPLVFIFKW